MKHFKKALLATAALLALSSQAHAQGITSGLDTANGVDQLFAVLGQFVGDWSQTHLTVVGGMQVMYDNSICTPGTYPGGNEGEQRYNTNLHYLEYCNGTAWVPVGQADPSGMVAYFLAYTCPTGWNPANGGNGTPDLRGEFIRGWDDGRGVEPGRGLATWEDATGIGQYVYQAAYLQFSNPDSLTYWGGQISRAGNNGYVNNQILATVRPRNVDLLACQKI